MLLALIFCIGAQGLRAQGYFTLTNGHYYWFDGRESDPDDSKYLTGYDQNQSWKKIWQLGTHSTASSVTEIVEQGTYYLALDTTDPANPKIQPISTTGGFNPLCVWQRTGNTGHYYQEWNGYKYYLYANHSEGVSIYKVAAGQQLQKSVTWYDWDHGLAIEEAVDVPGGKKTMDFWLIFDTLNDANGERATVPEWRMSEVNCYQRPEEIIYRNYRNVGGVNVWDTMYYYDNVRVTAMQKNFPAGVAATFMSVTKIEHPKTILAGHALDSLTVYVTGNSDDPNLEGYTFTYGESDITVMPIINTMVRMQSTPAYTEYVEEYYRRGINLNGSSRTTETFGSAGVPSVRRWYYYPDTNVYGGYGDITRYDVLPHTETEWTSAADWKYSLDSRSKRFLEVQPGTGNACYLHFKDRPLQNTDAYLTCTVTYYNGTSESITDTIHIVVNDDNVTLSSKRAPVVKGSVFGGGRMANVEGNTSIMVHNTDSIYALYGGNDIAGWVQGEEGATIQIGTRHTNANHPVHIGWVYGGGCGFYTYQGINIAHDEEGHPVDPYVHNGLKPNLEYQSYFFNGKVYKWNSLPSDYAANANQVVERYTARLTDPSSWSDAEVMAGYYNASWRDEDLVVDQTFSYIPYYYCNATDPANPQTDITQAYSATVDVTEDGNGSACMGSTSYMGTIPYIKTSHISVGVPEVDGHNDDYGHNAHEHNDHILIDSLFGGAENAFIGVTTTSGDYASAITVDVNGGTILALFGGNNYGGSIANTAMTLVNIHCTKLTDDESMVENTYYSGMGRSQGIRHVFGGGNKVESPHAQLSFYGGMVDTAFIGGNMASVKNPVGIVNCQRDGIGYGFDGRSGGTLQNGHFIYTNPTLTDTTFAGLRDATKNTNYVPDKGLYNVHFLFGGNNKANMENVSFVQLLSGGVGAVLGGGNKGDMVNDETFEEAVVTHTGYIDITPLLSTMKGIFARSKLISIPNKIGSVVAASQRSKIIADYVHGGCRQANIKHSCGVYLAGGSYFDIFAGNDISGDVGSENDGSTYAVITGDAVVHANVYGGNDGYYHCEDPENPGHYDDNKMGMDQFNAEVDYDPYGEMVGLLMPTQQHANVFVNGGVIKGNLVAGGVMANIGYENIARNPRIQYNGQAEQEMTGVGKNRGTVRLEIADTAKIYGNVFGGGANASVYGLSQLYVHGTPVIHGSLFAGNDCVGKVESFLPYRGNLEDPHQDLSYFKYYYDHLYAGGATIATTHNDSVAYMDAHMTQRERLLVESLNQASQLSSNGDSLNVYTTTVDGIKQYNPRYGTYVLIEDSPIINSVYGSGNGAWDYDGTRPQFPSTYVCAGTEGNRPDQKSTFIDIHTSGGFIDTVFGGGAGCTVAEDVVVLLNNIGTANTSYPGTSELRALGIKGGTPVSNGSNNSDNFVGTIFGGNNFSDMKTVPEIRLVQGNVKNIYGGGNAGNMTGLATLYDICGKEVKNVSTHVLSTSDQVTVTDSVFGGCRMSDIDGMAYVDIRKTSDGGINYIYGGNDVSGNVKGNTRIDLSGGLVQRIWGGSNGRYDFVPVDFEEYNVYHFGQYDAENPDDGLITTAGRPNVDSTTVNLWGGTINASVFTGGSMTDCRATCLTVDDQVGCSADGISTGHVTINGALYGGGEGRWDDLNARDLEGNRWGNVTGTTHVHLYHADNVTLATAYGGGGGGDVQNTWIKTYETWDSPFNALFGGGWGSDVLGTTYLEFNGKDLVKNLYGGNDFTGNVYNTEIVVNSGIFFNVYGGGNGDYPDRYYTSQHDDALAAAFSYQNASPTAYAGNKKIERPNTEYVHITFNDGTVDSCLYGGGKMGTILPYKKDNDGVYQYRLVDTNATPTATESDDLRRFIPDTQRVAYDYLVDGNHPDVTFADAPEKLSYIVVNIHGGKFKRNVFGGGRGFKKDKKALVYGLKVVNMDGGEIYESLYGGSEFVNDGYYAECKAPAGANPTLQQRLAATSGRPSSIVNLTGGTVGANLYGTGYQGMVYGSAYLNIGLDAIDSCTVWRNHYGTDTRRGAYLKFKPGYEGSYSDALTANKLILKNSVYSGANWGNASGETTFNNPGFVGGESRLYIDGKGYNTTNDRVTSDPEMNILRSIYGSGTSVLGGDVHSHVEVRNYGGMENCHPTKTIETIQRTDSLWLHNTAILFTGTTDASQQYMSNRYSIKNVKEMNYRGYNVSELQAAADNVENLGFFEQGTTATLHSGERFDTVVVQASHLNSLINQSACGDNVEICAKEYMVSPTEESKRHTLLILDNGVNLSIGNSTNYGAVTGFGYVVTPGGYQSTITARPKLVLTGDAHAESHYAYDGGFVTSCQDSNKTRALSSSLTDINPAWSSSGSIQSTDEVPYTNHATATAQSFLQGTNFREWKVGDKKGLREVEATLLAHNDPAKLSQDWSIDLNCGRSPNTASNKMGIAEAVFEMPATTAGHYYQLIGEGFTMTGSNGEIDLVDSAWHPTLNGLLTSGNNLNMGRAMSDINNWYSTGHQDANTHGEWINIPNGNANEMEGTQQILQHPEYTFGLIMVPNNNFTTNSTLTSTTYDEENLEGNYFDYLGWGDDPEFTYSPGATTVQLYDGMNAPDVFDLTAVKAFIVKVCDPEDAEDAGTYYYQADLGGGNYASTLSSYNMNLESGQSGYDADLKNYFNNLDYDCGAYTYTATVANNHYSYSYDMPSIDHDQNDETPNQVVGSDWAYFIINGNARVNSVNHYCSPKVYNDPGNPEVKPSMRLYLTYDTTFTNTFNGTVTFKMMEYDANGQEVAPILVKVYIQTIIDDLKDMEHDVMAMYNGGRTNSFTRKVEFVPVGEERNLYITGIKWLPTTTNGEDTTKAFTSAAFGNSDRFSLLPDTNQVLATIAGVYPHEVSDGHPGDNNHNSHNRFAMSIIPTNNVSEDAGMANGWLRGTNIRTNLYELAYPSGTNPVKTCEWDAVGDSVAVISLKNKNGNDSHGYFLGTLDGRGSAMLNVELGFDGTRVYDAMDGKGYVGKVVLTLESFSEEDDISRGSFDVTIYVKTRSHGDTIYMASASSVTRQIAPNKSVTVYPYSDVEHNGTSFQKNEIGKTPGLYVQSFRKALEDGIYQEGDVLCIIDQIVIDDTPVHITGPNGPPIEVVRYDGHHHQLPDEQSVYRGPMIVVKDGGSFTAENIAFHGSAGSRIKKVVRATPGDDNSNADLNGDKLQFVESYTIEGNTYDMDKVPDTNMVYGPIIEVTGRNSTTSEISKVNLREGTIVHHNWNGYGHVNLADGTAGDQVIDATGMPVDTKSMGAISVTDGAILSLSGNVTVENNFGHTMTGLDDLEPHDAISVQKAPGNAAVYVDGGTIELSEANRNTAVTITNNYLMNPLVHSGSFSWWSLRMVEDKPERYVINPAAFDSQHPANVLLTRKAPATGTDYEKIMNDTQSDLFVISGTLGDNTKIGVRKWFPGIHERDTIQIATAKGGNNTLLELAMLNENIQSDDHFRVFYNSLVDLTTAYFFRCATFRHQLASDTYIGPVYEYSDANTSAHTLTLASGDVLHFGMKDNFCPAGGDSVIYRVQGGLMPYTFTWSDPNKDVVLSETVTPYSNAQVQYDLAGADGTLTEPADRYAKYKASMADTLVLPYEPMGPTDKRTWNHIHVTATDATGECKLYKNVDLRILMDHSISDPVTYIDYAAATVATDTVFNPSAPNSGWQTSPSNGWTDTTRTTKAIASRNFKGVQITPKVWVNRSSGIINAVVEGSDPVNDYVYQFVGESESHELSGLNFCPGDTITLYTEPRGATTKFIMWDFDPYYRPLARYIVPPHDDSVIAYYGPDQYWHEHINSVSAASAIYDNNYTYSNRDGHSYVTTYNGDVHIYDENGLAWFISVVNGLNGTQARPFYFNKVYLHQKDGGYDMKDYLWTPVGTLQHKFRGWFIGVGNSSDSCTVPLSGDDRVVIKNIIVNEPQADYAGFFAFLDTARIYRIELNSSLVRGSQYVGALAARSRDSKILGCAVTDSAENSSTVTILSTHYVSGGMIGWSDNDSVVSSLSKAKYVGDAVYSGGVIGHGEGNKAAIVNTYARNDNRMEGLYLGGLAGYLDGNAPVHSNKRKSANGATIANNYVYLTSNGRSQRVGGIVGYAKNTLIENNYVYGTMAGSATEGGVGAVLDEGSVSDHNYYEEGSVSRSVGQLRGNATMSDNTTFQGQGNQVATGEEVDGIGNLTRLLNRWVRTHGAQYRTWRSDLENTNYGYPIFGTPDMIPVRDSLELDACDSIEVAGRIYTSDGMAMVHVIDSVEMIDSVTVLRFYVHHSSHEQYSDSVSLGQAYSGYGFEVSATECELLHATVLRYGSATLVLSDTLTGANGCDSIISLTLTVFANTAVTTPAPTHLVNVYPNPTVGQVTIEASGLSHVELYDNEGRRLQDYLAPTSDQLTIDIAAYPAGAYYLRIYDSEGVTIQKLIKK